MLACLPRVREPQAASSKRWDEKKTKRERQAKGRRGGEKSGRGARRDEDGLDI